jgi:hypothetical protein
MTIIANDVPTSAHSLEVRAAARPDWRRQRHTWFLASLVAANVVFDGLAVGRVFNGATSSATTVFIGMLLAQVFLMGLWMALGGLHPAARIGVVVATTLAGTAAFWLGLGRHVGELWNLLTYSGMIVLATHALLLPLRALLGWRIDFDPAYHARSTDKSMQLRLMHLIAFTTACALPFALARFHDDFDVVLQVFAFGGIGLAAAAPVAWVVVAARRSLRFWIPAGGMLLFSLIVDFWALAELFSPNSQDALFVYLGAAATVLANLGVLRFFFGLRLFSVLGPAGPSAAAKFYASLDPDLAFMIDAWPRLPVTLRNEFLQKVRSAAEPDGKKDACEKAAEAVVA